MLSTFIAATLATSARAASGVAGLITGPEVKMRALLSEAVPCASRAAIAAGALASLPRLKTVVTPYFA